jgi:hypothetical protein
MAGRCSFPRDRDDDYAVICLRHSPPGYDDAIIDRPDGRLGRTAPFPVPKRRGKGLEAASLLPVPPRPAVHPYGIIDRQLEPKSNVAL